MNGTATVQRPRLKVRYDTEVRAQLQESLALANIMEVPRFEKIVINMGVGKATQTPSLLEGAIIGPAMLILISQVFVRGSRLSSELPRLPAVVGLQILMGLANLRGTVQALIGRGTAFERTPKLATQSAVPSGHTRYAPETGP